MNYWPHVKSSNQKWMGAITGCLGVSMLVNIMSVANTNSKTSAVTFIISALAMIVGGALQYYYLGKNEDTFKGFFRDPTIFSKEFKEYVKYVNIPLWIIGGILLISAVIQLKTGEENTFELNFKGKKN